MTVNYSALQGRVKNLIQNKLSGYPVTVRLLNNTTISTVGVFTSGQAENIDTRQNPTWMTGETGRYVNVPGIDFYGAITAGQTTTPQVGGTVEWTINNVLYKKVIKSVGMEMPIPNLPILFILEIE